MYAIIEACGRQYKVSEGDVVFFEKLNEEVGKKVSFDKVVLLSNDGKVEVGNPYVANAKVDGKVVSQGRGKKIVVFKYKAKKNERRTLGHRQDYTKVEITSINGVSKAKTENKKAEVKEDAKAKETVNAKEDTQKKETKTTTKSKK